LKKFFISFFLCMQSVYPQPRADFVVTADLLGELGNWFFIISTAETLVKEGYDVAFFKGLEDPKFSDYKTHFFQKVLAECPPSIRVYPREKLYTQRGDVTSYCSIPKNYNLRLKGHFVNLKYFDKHRDHLIDLFETPSLDLEYIKKKYPVVFESKQICAVHYRHYIRSLDDPKRDKNQLINPKYLKHSTIFCHLDTDYYEKAMNIFGDDTLFIVVSDDPWMAKKVLPMKKNMLFIENEPFWVDFNILRYSPNAIIGNSTFSWWATYLNNSDNKKVVAPTSWYRNIEKMVFPDDWIKIDSVTVEDTYKDPMEWLLEKEFHDFET